MSKKKSIADRGKFKKEIHSALYKSDEIKEMLLGDVSGLSASDIQKLFKEHVKSHLFIDDTIKEAGTYIFYDVRIPKVYSQTKQMMVYMYLICHRSLLENYSKEGYYGDRIDILAQMVEDVLVANKETSNKFGIGELSLDSLDIYNASRFYGCILTLSVPTFRYAS